METEKPYEAPFTYESGIAQIRDKNFMHVLDIRGHGHLTSPNFFNLSEEEAAKVQDELGERIANLLNMHADLKKDVDALDDSLFA
jgi:hypothetical protein